MTRARAFEWCVAVGALFLLTDVADNELHVLTPAHPLLPRVILAPFFAAAAGVLVRHWQVAGAEARHAWPPLLLVVLAALSWTWSTDPSVTAGWLVGLVGTTCVGLMIALRFDRDEQLAILGIALGLVVALSATVVFAWPAHGIRPTQRGPTWSGVFEDNNLFGRIMSLSTLVYFVMALQRPGRRFVAVPACIVSALLLFGSRSLTALSVAGTCILVVCLMHYRGHDAFAARRRFVITALFVALALAAIVEARVRQVAGERPLSGRVAVWEATLSVARQHPWLGHGYATFWPRMQTAPPPDSAGTWPLRHPHNGFVQLFFELGAAGVLAFAVPYLVLLRRAVAGSATQLWPPAFLLFLFLSNLTETGLLGHKIFWALYVSLWSLPLWSLPLWSLPPSGGKVRMGSAEQD